MNTIISREELIEKYVINEFEEEYIYCLGNEVYEQMAEVIEDMPKWGDKVTFFDVMEQAMVTCIHTFDFETNDIMEQRFPNINYNMLHYKSSQSEYSIKMDGKGCVTFKLNMTPEQHMIMSLLGKLKEMEEYIYEQGVAHKCIIKATIGVDE